MTYHHEILIKSDVLGALFGISFLLSDVMYVEKVQAIKGSGVAMISHLDIHFTDGTVKMIESDPEVIESEYERISNRIAEIGYYPAEHGGNA
ncbi:MAG: hypothetical protein WC455_25615 [Dehalococcoidia bacterium]|jgi:hypothetical protein